MARKNVMNISNLDSVTRHLRCVPRNALTALACSGQRRENPQTFAMRGRAASLVGEF